MNFSSRERWPVLRELHEVHAIPLEMLAIVADKNLSTITNRAESEDWAIGGQGRFDLNKVGSMVDRLAAVTNGHLEQLGKEGEISPTAEKQLRMFSALVSSINKFAQMKMQLGQSADQDFDAKRGKEGDDTGHAGEDILALRADIEAFIDALGEEEIDPQVSGEIER